MSITATPSLGPTGTIQVATPFNYSFAGALVNINDPATYAVTSGVATRNVLSDAVGSTGTIACASDAPVVASGTVYDMSKMQVGQVLEIKLPVLSANGYQFDPGQTNYLSYVNGQADIIITGSRTTSPGTYTYKFNTGGTPASYVNGDRIWYTVLSGLTTVKVEFVHDSTITTLSTSITPTSAILQFRMNVNAIGIV
jgi:hypothetical protein